MLEPTDFFVIRIPTLSFNNLEELNIMIKDKNIKKIKEMWSNPQFLNAVYLSSRDFYFVALNWLQKDDLDLSDSIFQSLYKYYVRMCTRCTPYGLFAGFSFGKIHDHSTRIKISNKNIDPKVRIDILTLKKIKNQIIKTSSYNNLPLYKNNTLYKLGTNWRYISWDKDYNYEISEVSQDNILNKIFGLAESGISTIELRDFLINELEKTSSSEIETYINLLRESNILVDRLPPYMTSTEDPLIELDRYLKKYYYDTSILQPILDLQNDINGDFFNSNELINKIERLTKKYSGVIHENQQIFQIDSKINLLQNYINASVTSTLAKRIEELFPLIMNGGNNRMNDFINKFHKKFESEEIQLVKALDPDYGVGYDFYVSGNLEETPLLDDIYFTFSNPKSNHHRISDLMKRILKNHISSFSTAKILPIILTDDDIESIKGEQISPSFGNNCHLFGTLISDSQIDIENGNFKFLPYSSIPTGNANQILSRFAYYDNNISENLRTIIENDSENFIYVELLHHREDRLANVLLRQNFYNYELPYVSESKNDKSKVILIDDIFIRYENGKIKLRSKRLNKEIKPRYSNAYNFEDNQLPIINFLGDFQNYDTDAGFRWDWEFMIDNDYLPRVEYKELILSESRWKIYQDKAITIQKLKNIIRDKNIPYLCSVKKRDNVLLLDTRNEACLNILVKLITKGPFWLYEYIEPVKFKNEKDDEFISEFIFPFKCAEKKNEIIQTSDFSYKKSNRKFLPGDDWTYFKIYTSHKYGDQIIKEILCKYLKTNQNFMETCWFFIRYNDPEFHIRLRIKNRASTQSISNLNKLLKKLTNDGIVSSVEINTYNREIERYGIENIELAELYFMYDSTCVIECLSIDVFNEELRWKIAILSLDYMMNDFEINLKDRILLFKDYFESLMSENVVVSNIEFKKRFKVSIDKKHRTYKCFLDSILRLNDYSEVQSFVKPFNKRSVNTSEIISSIRDNTINEAQYLSLVKNFIHMNMNRIFLTKARMHEFIIYFLMYKTYNSIYQRNK